MGGTSRTSSGAGATARPLRAAHAPPAAGPAPVSPRALELLARSDAELVAAQLSSDPGERYVHAHLAALRAGAALVDGVGQPRRRGGPRTVWDMVALADPALRPWASYFAAGARHRSAVEAGRADAVDDALALRNLEAAEGFQDAVREALGLLTPGGRGRSDLRAS